MLLPSERAESVSCPGFSGLWQEKWSCDSVCVSFPSGVSRMNSADGFTWLSCWWPHFTGWPGIPCCWRISGKGVQTPLRKSWSTPSRKRWKNQSVSPWDNDPAQWKLTGRVGGPLALGNDLSFILEGSSVDLRLWLWEIKHTHNNGFQSHPGDPYENSSRSLLRTWPSPRRSRVSSGRKSSTSQMVEGFVFHIHAEPKHKANRNKHHRGSFRRINYHSLFLGHWNPGPI